MTSPRRSSRLSTTLALIAALGLPATMVTLSGCKKAADSASPDGGGSGGGQTAGGGHVLRYKAAPARLKENLNVAAQYADCSGILR